MQSGDLHFQTYVELEIDIDIDIKPGSFPNSINLKSKAVIPVAPILPTNTFTHIMIESSKCRVRPKNGVTEVIAMVILRMSMGMARMI